MVFFQQTSNNYGFISEDERNTPQAFSHFTYEASSQTLLICDIQGVGDVYTDPQVHTSDGKGCGKGNMGRSGFDQFLETHRYLVLLFPCIFAILSLLLPSSN